MKNIKLFIKFINLTIMLISIFTSLNAKQTDREFVKQQIKKHFSSEWQLKKLHRFTDGTDGLYDIITAKNKDMYSLTHIAVNKNKKTKSIVAVIQKYIEFADHSEGTELVFYEWIIDRKTDLIKEKYQTRIDSCGSFGQSFSKFKYETITDSSSVLIYEEDYFGQGMHNLTAKLIYKGKIILSMDDYTSYSDNHEPDESVDGVDTNMVWSDIIVDKKDSTVFVNTVDWRNYLSSGETYFWSEYKLQNNRLILLNTGDKLR